MAGRDVSTSYVERAAEALGREVAEDEKLVVEPPEAEEPLAPTLYLRWCQVDWNLADGHFPDAVQIVFRWLTAECRPVL